jgi:hypothetical protein
MDKAEVKQSVDVLTEFRADAERQVGGMRAT